MAVTAPPPQTLSPYVMAPATTAAEAFPLGTKEPDNDDKERLRKDWTKEFYSSDIHGNGSSRVFLEDRKQRNRNGRKKYVNRDRDKFFQTSNGLGNEIHILCISYLLTFYCLVNLSNQ